MQVNVTMLLSDYSAVTLAEKLPWCERSAAVAGALLSFEMKAISHSEGRHGHYPDERGVRVSFPIHINIYALTGLIRWYLLQYSADVGEITVFCVRYSSLMLGCWCCKDGASAHRRRVKKAIDG